MVVVGGIPRRLGNSLLPVLVEVSPLVVLGVLGTFCLLLYHPTAILTFFAVFERIFAVDIVIQAVVLLLATFGPLKKNF